jgi:hypothetical protein
MDEIKVSLFSNDMILYLTDLKNSIIKLLDLINTFSKTLGYKINTHVKISSFSIHQIEQNENEIRKIIPFIMSTKISKSKFNEGS